MDMGLANKRALVLGAAGGLGGAIATSLAAEGAQLFLVDRDAEGLERIVAEIGADRANSATWNMADTDAAESIAAKAEAAMGGVDVLINNTGGPPPTTAAGQPLELWTDSFESMVLSVIRLTDCILPGMTKRGWGRIVTSTSSGIIEPIPNLAISNALRMSLVGWSKTLAAEVGPKGVTCNIVLPGRVATGRITQLDEKKAEREGRSVQEIQSESTGMIPLRRYGNPKEYGDAVCFLASERASYITGNVLRVDGGLIRSA